jgi:hypothetical protein
LDQRERVSSRSFLRKFLRDCIAAAGRETKYFTV